MTASLNRKEVRSEAHGSGRYVNIDNNSKSRLSVHIKQDEKCVAIGLENLKERDNLEDVALDGRIIFK
jgi:hypothetical protein